MTDLEVDARTLYSKWNPAVWESFCRGPGSRLAKSLEGRADRRELLESYLALGREAVGLQYIDQPTFDPNPPAPPTFLAAFWVDVLPRLLPAVPPVHSSELLAKIWNVGERLVREPVWLTRYLTGCLDRLRDLTRFESWLRETLTPVVDEPPPARWTGPMNCTIVDCRPFHDEFLPGKIHLAAPAVACVHDRREERARLGILLRHGSGSLCLGRTPCLGDYRAADGQAPPVSFGKQGVLVGSREVPLPHFGTPQGHAVAPTGFVIAAARASQRLWIVESP